MIKDIDRIRFLLDNLVPTDVAADDITDAHRLGQLIDMVMPDQFDGDPLDAWSYVDQVSEENGHGAGDEITPEDIHQAARRQIDAAIRMHAPHLDVQRRHREPEFDVQTGPRLGRWGGKFVRIEF